MITIGTKVTVAEGRIDVRTDVPEVMTVTSVTVDTDVTPPQVKIICDNSYTFEADMLEVIDNTPVTHLVSINRINRTDVYTITIAPFRSEVEQEELMIQLSQLFRVRIKQISVTNFTDIRNVTKVTDSTTGTFIRYEILPQ